MIRDEEYGEAIESEVRRLRNIERDLSRLRSIELELSRSDPQETTVA